MTEAHDIMAAVDTRTPMTITETTTEADEAASRAHLGMLNDSGVGIQRFEGVPPWEIHRDSDELLYVVAGDVELTIVEAGGPEVIPVRGGEIVIVPKGCWHRGVAKTMVTLFSVTPFTGSDLAFTDQPPAD